ncbi:SusD-like starch-binding protein associating with outer membrane [Flavobacterium araucananum]|uniref:SusD/RagB family nutrient-binding outer membrane lipoprotein n=1 Tax=Flavobacterium araucananum TaxID=946678 RepID=A0A227PHC0_9FLAO|nr:SusD/RagB family nutrient-binding outer membrane lipoprotein [Flavobacterium araucananum]OXG08698.1 hypothetical protein B0A64_04545 [Flavobacterium araucananum]PWJ97813.1 SusD-like starch-binding protein associating with outer membrane [Flavobacterium araucananum]
MKKIILILTVLTVFSCQNEIDTFNENPNNPTEVTPALLLTQTEVATFNIHSGDLSRITSLLTQQIAGNDGQYLAYATYTFSETDMDNSWSTLYQNAGLTASDNIKKNGADNPYYSGMSKILLALNVSKATDLWNDVPLSKAFQGLTGIIQPAYDKQQDVYTQLQQLLDDAIVDLAKPASANKKIPASDDLIYGGDVSLWTKAAYTLKARFALRLTNRDGATVAANKAITYLAKGMKANSDDMNAVFSADASSSWNQWYAFASARPNYIKMGKYFVDYLVSTSDPRLPRFVAKDADGNFTGLATNQENNDASDLGPAIVGSSSDGTSPSKPLGMVTFAEAKFIEAEAKLLTGDASAQQSFKDAVSASLLNYVGSVDNTFVNTVTTTVSVKSIIEQKYIALFTNPEVYNDYRRTGFPVLIANPDVAPSQIPQRLPTPSNERLYNPNATVVTNTTSKVWWAL